MDEKFTSCTYTHVFCIGTPANTRRLKDAIETVIGGLTPQEVTNILVFLSFRCSQGTTPFVYRLRGILSPMIYYFVILIAYVVKL